MWIIGLTSILTKSLTSQVEGAGDSVAAVAVTAQQFRLECYSRHLEDGPIPKGLGFQVWMGLGFRSSGILRNRKSASQLVRKNRNRKVHLLRQSYVQSLFAGT